MNLTNVNKIVSKLQAILFKNANSFSIGMLKSHFRGVGLQFKEHQIYSYGDDIRFLDWRMLAKTSHPYVKTFEEERNVEIVVVIDASISMLSGANYITKLQAAIEITCLLFLLSKETNDKVHAVVISDEVISLPPKAGHEGISYFVGILEKHKIINENGSVNIDRPFFKSKSEKNREKILSKHLAFRREIVILSDLINLFSIEFLNRLTTKSHVHCFQIISPLDEMNTSPYKIFAHGDQEVSKGNYMSVNKQKKNHFMSKRKHIKKLKVHDRYLEEFVKEML